MKQIEDLIPILDLEQIEENIFRGESHFMGSPRVFGGQILAQTIRAAQLTVPDDRHIHSMHGYFILPGDLTKPIVFMVDRIRDGRSFTTRRVIAVQNGKAIFNMAASFQIEEEGYDHQVTMPDVPPPDELMNSRALVEKYKEHIPAGMKAFLSQPRPIEFRPVAPEKSFGHINSKPSRSVWMKANGVISDDNNLHRMLLAYASDYNLLSTALQPHRSKIQNLVMASLDHAMWFHRKFRMDEWLLYSLDSPSASNSRGFTRGSVYNQEGILVASVVQEGLMRIKTKKK
jgi:acyl-CoA thioesterase-2